MVESWLLRRRVEARIFVGELAEALGGQRGPEVAPDNWTGSDDDWVGAGFEVERVEDHFGSQGR